MNTHRDHAAKHLDELDVDAVQVQVATDIVQRFLSQRAPVHGEQVVRHQQQADGRVASEPVDERIARHRLDGAHEMRECRAMHHVDALEQCGGCETHRRIGVRGEGRDERFGFSEQVVR